MGWYRQLKQTCLIIEKMSGTEALWRRAGVDHSTGCVYLTKFSKELLEFALCNTVSKVNLVSLSWNIKHKRYHKSFD